MGTRPPYRAGAYRHVTVPRSRTKAPSIIELALEGSRRDLTQPVFAWLVEHGHVSDVHFLRKAGVSTRRFGSPYCDYRYMAKMELTDMRRAVHRSLFDELLPYHILPINEIIRDVLSVSERNRATVFTWVEFLLSEDFRGRYDLQMLQLIAMVGDRRLEPVFTRLFKENRILKHHYIEVLELLGAMCLLRYDSKSCSRLWSCSLGERNSCDSGAPMESDCDSATNDIRAGLTRVFSKQAATPHERLILAFRILKRADHEIRFFINSTYLQRILTNALDLSQRWAKSLRDCVESLAQLAKWSLYCRSDCVTLGPNKLIRLALAQANSSVFMNRPPSESVVTVWSYLEKYGEDSTQCPGCADLRNRFISLVLKRNSIEDLASESVDVETLTWILQSLIARVIGNESECLGNEKAFRTLLFKGALTPLSGHMYLNMLQNILAYRNKPLFGLAVDSQCRCDQLAGMRDSVAALRCLAARVARCGSGSKAFDPQISMQNGLVRIPLSQFVKAHKHFATHSKTREQLYIKYNAL